MDFSDLISALSENKGALAAMIDDFLQICPQRMELIEKDIRSRDASNLEKNAHQFKSAISIWGQSSALDILTALEEEGRQENFPQAEKLMRELPGQLTCLEDALMDLRDSL